MSKAYKYWLTYNAVRTELTVDPAGWDENGLIYERNKIYHGVLRSYSLSLRFARQSNPLYEGGGEIIKTAYETDGLNAEIDIEIEKYNGQTQDYDNFYTGILDIKPSRFKIYRDFVEVAIIDGSKENKFITNDEVEFDLNSTTSLDGTAITAFASSPRTVTIDGITQVLNAITNAVLNELYPFEFANYPEQVSAYYQADNITLNDLFNNLIVSTDESNIKIYENRSDTSKIIIPIIDCDYSFSNTAGGAGGIGNPCDVDITYTSRITQYDKDGGMKFFVDVRFDDDIDGVQTNLIVNIPTISVAVLNTGTLLLSTTQFLLESGDYLEFYINYGTTKMDIRSLFLNSINIYSFNTFSIEEWTSTPDVTRNAYLPYEVFTRLIQLQTGETDTAKLIYSSKYGRGDSEFQTYGTDGDGSLLPLLPGKILRGFDDSPYNVSFRDYFKSLDALHNIGAGYDRINERFFIEDKSEFYKSGLLMFTLSGVVDLTVTPYDQYYFNEIKAGYKNNVEYEERNGVNEFNTPADYSVNQPVKNTLDISSPYNADTLGIFYSIALRKSEIGNKDTKYDDNNFLLDVSRYITSFISEVDTYDRNVPDAVLTTQQIYNLKYTPRENLIRWANILKVQLWKDTGIDVNFVKSQKNFDFEYTNKDGNTVNELDDIAQSELVANRLFNPEIIEGECIVTAAMITQLNNDPHGVVGLTFDEVDYYGFIIKFETKDYNKKANFTLLAVDYVTGTEYLFEDDQEFLFDEGPAPIITNYEFEN